MNQPLMSARWGLGSSGAVETRPVLSEPPSLSSRQRPGPPDPRSVEQAASPDHLNLGCTEGMVTKCLRLTQPHIDSSLWRRVKRPSAIASSGSPASE